MFYFASDNPLARGMVSQLKTLKQAGFHPEANVVVHFDANTENTSALIFDINAVNKIRAGGKARRLGFQPRFQDCLRLRRRARPFVEAGERHLRSVSEGRAATAFSSRPAASSLRPAFS